MLNSALGAGDGVLKMTRAIIFSRVVYKLEKADLLSVQGAGVAGAGNVARSFAGSTLILLQGGVE